MKGIIGKKIGMTSIFTPEGKSIPCTVIEAGPCVVTQIKTQDKDGYEAIQVGYDEKKAKNTTKAQLKHFEAASTTPKRKVMEFKGFAIDKALGDMITSDIFTEGEIVNVTGTSKGKG